MNRFEIALQAIEKINPGIIDKYLEKELLVDSKSRPQKDLVPRSSSDAAYIRNLLPLPAYTILLGICEDGSPLMLDLADPCCGSILISGQQPWVISSALYAVLDSASIINSANVVQYAIITSNPESFSTIIQRPQCLNSFYSYSRSADEFVMGLSALVEQRNTGRQRGPAIILAIDDLSLFTNHIDEDVYAHFKWLIREGPFVKVWPIVTSFENDLSTIGIDLVQSFGTRILEYAKFPISKPFVGEVREDFVPQISFEVQSRRERISFYLPAS